MSKRSQLAAVGVPIELWGNRIARTVSRPAGPLYCGQLIQGE